jgi:hypothetical protein
MVKHDQAELINELVSAAGSEERELCRHVVDLLLGLGYSPQKQRVRGLSLAFKSNRTKQTIAKIAITDSADRAVLYSFKYYACKSLPEKFSDAVREAIESTNGQYRCCGCGACGAKEGERGYRSAYPEGEDFLRCGAYVVRIPELGMGDLDDLRRVLSEQHGYFMSRLA